MCDAGGQGMKASQKEFVMGERKRQAISMAAGDRVGFAPLGSASMMRASPSRCAGFAPSSRCATPSTRALSQRRPAGFTIPELLTIVAILALVISIMLPSLEQAREHTRTAICLSGLHQAGIGFLSYAADCRNYIPGPNTSGYHLKGVSPGNTTGSPTDPITFDDWMSPTLGRAISLPQKKIDRLLAILNNQFKCPSNNQKYDYIYGPGIPGVTASKTSYSSYSAPFTMHYYQDAVHAAQSGQPNGSHFGNSFDKGVDVRPAGHRFRTWTLGSPSQKVAATEGSRYIDASGTVSFNTDQGSAYGGNFMNRSPTLNVYYQGNGNPYKFGSYPNLHADAIKYAYRHANQRINTVFFDGHAATMSNLESRKVSLWYPTGAKVIDTSVIGDQSVNHGYTIE